MDERERGAGRGGGKRGVRTEAARARIPSLSEAPPSARSNDWKSYTRTVRTPEVVGDGERWQLFSVDDSYVFCGLRGLVAPQGLAVSRKG